MLKIALATGDGTAVDQHFGWCRRFDIYRVDAEGAVLLESRTLPPPGRSEQDKIGSRVAAVLDCNILVVCDMGDAAAAQVVEVGVHPMKMAVGGDIGELLTGLQAVLAGDPPPWLRKVLDANAPQNAPSPSTSTRR